METINKFWNPNESLKDEYNRIHKLPEGPFVKFHHGSTNTRCFVCDAEIDEFITGKRVDYRIDGTRNIDTICINCFVEPEYWEGKEIIQVTNF